MTNGSSVNLTHERLRRAAFGAMTGGILFFLNWVWQTYLDMSSGADSILHDTSHPAFYLNVIMQFLAMWGFLLALFAVNKHIAASGSGIMWKIGFFLSAIGQFLFALTLLEAFIFLLGQTSLSDMLSAIIGIGNMIMFLGALPLGIFLLSRNTIPRTGSLLFLLTVPAVIAYFVLSSMNLPLLGGLLVGGVYGGAWFVIGTFLKRSK